MNLNYLNIWYRMNWRGDNDSIDASTNNLQQRRGDFFFATNTEMSTAPPGFRYV